MVKNSNIKLLINIINKSYMQQSEYNKNYFKKNSFVLLIKNITNATVIQ